MTEVTETFVDRADWPAGPWDDEPDRVEWTDEATSLPCLALRNMFGAWCGYVAIPPTHPWHGMDYDEVPIEVHGGFTFAESYMNDDRRPKVEQVCHQPAPGEPDDVWWLGFDCNHLYDRAPGMLGRFGERLAIEGEVYRDLDYVRLEIVNVASRLADVGANLQ